MSAERVMKVLANMPQGLDNTQKAQARDNISCKSRQNPIELNYADYGFVKKLTQDAEGVVNLECSYISAATSSVTGLMSSSDKSKLDGIASGAQVNQNAFSVIKVGNDSILADTATDTLTLVAGSNITLTTDAANDLLTISATDTNTHRPIQVNGSQNLGDNVTPLNLKAGSNVTLTANGGDVTIAAASAPSQVNADWTSSSGASQILHKPTIAKKAYGGSVTELSSLVVDADDGDGYVDLMVDNGSWGKLVAGPYATLLNSGVAGSVGDTDTPIYIDTNGQFAACTALPTVEYIAFNYSNETTAQNSVYTAVAAAYTAGKWPVLYCGVANATLYWFPTASGSNGYSFARTVSNYSYVVTIDATTHVISHQSKEIINYTAGSNISISANNEISATDTTYSAGSYIDITNNVVSNTMHIDTTGLMVSYNTLSNAGVTTHSWGPWRLKITKKAMVTWDTTDASIEIRFAHSDYIDGSITNGACLVEPFYPWKDGNWDAVYTGHTRWGFTGAYDGGPTNGYTILLDGPTDADNANRSMPKKIRGYKFNISCGIDKPDWLECTIMPMYINNNTSINSNGARLLIQAKYFYV